MVYGGKPSRGCKTCKNRRIKCDETRPTCIQCRKSKRDCFGYPEETDLIFRNETVSTERKARRSTTAERRTHAPGGTASLNTDFELSIARGNCGAWANNADFLVPPSFMQCPEEEALCYWFLNLVMLPRHPESICGFMEHLLPMYQHAKVDSQLSLITTAAAFSALGKVPGRESLMPMATKMYSKALTAVKSALYDPIEAKKDETLMTVLLMCLYETTLCSSRESMACYYSDLTSFKATNKPRLERDYHTDGAVALVKYRGEEQLQNEMSRNLLQAVRTQMVMSCIQRKKPIDILPGHTEWIANLRQQNAANRLTILTARLPELRSNAEKTMSSPFNDAKVEDVRALRDAAAELDVYIAEWVNGLPEAWSYEAIAHVDAMPDDISRADAFPGDIDVYEDLYVASIWNSYRVARFLVLSIMMDSICWLTSVSKQQQENDYVETLAIIRRLVSEICASVPFHLCCRTSSAALELQYPHSAAASNASNHQPKTRVLGAYFLLSPLKIMLHHCDDTYTYRQWKHKQWSYLSIEQEAWLEGRLATVRSLCVRDC